MSEEFIKQHKVKSVDSRYVNGGSIIIVEFEDGRIIDKVLMGADFDYVMESARGIIINNSIISQRKRKIKSIVNNIK